MSTGWVRLVAQAVERQERQGQLEQVGWTLLLPSWTGEGLMSYSLPLLSGLPTVLTSPSMPLVFASEAETPTSRSRGTSLHHPTVMDVTLSVALLGPANVTQSLSVVMDKKVCDFKIVDTHIHISYMIIQQHLMAGK